MKPYPIRVFFNAYIDIMVDAEDVRSAYREAAQDAIDNMSDSELRKNIQLQYDFAEVIE